jgi:hypothetical protein
MLSNIILGCLFVAMTKTPAYNGATKGATPRGLYEKKLLLCNVWIP